MSNNFDARLQRLESLNPSAKREAYRAYLAAFFERAGEQYDGHRQQIIEALSSATPQYDFEYDGQHFHLSWHHRAAGGAPLIVTAPASIWDAV